MFSAIKNYLIAGLGFALSVAIALLYRSKAKYEGAMRKGVEQVRKTEQKASEAMVKGLEREKKAREKAKIAIRDRNHFGNR